jgi:type II secretory pathway pseudopilin PulG
MKRINLNSGQTLVEIIVVVGVVVLLVTGLVIGTTSSLRIGEAGKIRSQAVKLAQEGIELARTVRDTQWSSFAAMNGAYCLGETNVWTPATGICAVNIGTTFTRTVDFAFVDPRMTVTATVTWQDSNGTKQTSLKTYFTKWK